MFLSNQLVKFGKSRQKRNPIITSKCLSLEHNYNVCKIWREGSIILLRLALELRNFNERGPSLESDGDRCTYMVGGHGWTSAPPTSLMSNFPRFKEKFHKKLKRNGKLPLITTGLTAWAAASIKHRGFFRRKLLLKPFGWKWRAIEKYSQTGSLLLKFPPPLL